MYENNSARAPYLSQFCSNNAIFELRDFINKEVWQKELSVTILIFLNQLTRTEREIRFAHILSRIADKAISASGHLIHKLKAKDSTGRWAYYFVLVTEEREDLFLEAIEGDGTIDLEDYGNVVASCYGKAPTQEVKDYLKEKYNFDI